MQINIRFDSIYLTIWLFSIMWVSTIWIEIFIDNYSENGYQAYFHKNLYTYVFWCGCYNFEIFLRLRPSIGNIRWIYSELTSNYCVFSLFLLFYWLLILAIEFSRQMPSKLISILFLLYIFLGIQFYSPNPFPHLVKVITILSSFTLMNRDSLGIFNYFGY